MKFLDRLQADLKQALAQQEHDLVVQVLQKRFAELTLDDLHALLKSPLGRGLGKVRVAALVTNVAASATPPSSAARQKGSQAKVKPPRKSKKSASSKKAAPATRSSEAIVNTLLAALAGDRPRSQIELTVATKANRKTVRKMLAALTAAGRIRVTGTEARPRYSLAATKVDPIEAEGTKETKGAKNGKKTKKAKKAKKGAKVTGRTISGREGYDAAVLAALRSAPESWISSTDLLAATGGTLAQLRNALSRLLAAGKARRQGERNTTRYTLSDRT